MQKAYLIHPTLAVERKGTQALLIKGRAIAPFILDLAFFKYDMHTRFASCLVVCTGVKVFLF